MREEEEEERRRRGLEVCEVMVETALEATRSTTWSWKLALGSAEGDLDTVHASDKGGCNETGAGTATHLSEMREEEEEERRRRGLEVCEVMVETALEATRSTTWSWKLALGSAEGDLDTVHASDKGGCNETGAGEHGGFLGEERRRRRG
ncbi:uncharacterized protein A4U43_C01F24810 [Asparagus officinalis]|uniref:Uncharacterized protein n=1 Tax=Asparagus officinalis TaxID=4686 RepID=A0A5P1FSI3_ASPOF|nr:uncharacterized protein A4U43_C01F24810 [Asparagus officinalis]